MSGDLVTWSSSDTSIATVSDNGIVAGVAGGIALVKAAAGLVEANVTVTVDEGWASVNTGHLHTCGLNNAGESYCWGYSKHGALGIGASAIATRPHKVGGGHIWSSVEAGIDYSCGVTTSGKAYCWGSGLNGRLGNGLSPGNANQSLPTLVAGDYSWGLVSSDLGRHSCGVATSGEAYCWGENIYGQIGDGTTEASHGQRDVPVLVSGGLSWSSVDVSRNHTCGVTTADEAYCWGRNSVGEIGNGGTSTHNCIKNGGSDECVVVPMPVSRGLTWASVSGGGTHTCGITTVGEGYCWGYNASGQLGDGTTKYRDEPELVNGGLTWASILGGYLFSCGVTTVGEGYCWGQNDRGQLGDGTTTDHLVPTLVSGGHVWRQIDPGGDYHTCGVTTTGEAYCWGEHGPEITDGLLGNGTTTDSSIPLKVTRPW